NRLFVQYSAADQLAVVRELKAEGMSVRNKALDSMTALFGTFMAALGGIVAHDVSQVRIGFWGEVVGFIMISLALLLWLKWKTSWAAWSLLTKTSSNELVIVQLYRRMRAYLSRQGLSRSAAIA